LLLLYKFALNNMLGLWYLYIYKIVTKRCKKFLNEILNNKVVDNKIIIEMH